MEKQKNNNGIIFLLIIIIIIMGIITVLALNGTINLSNNQSETKNENTEEITNNDNNESIKYNYSDVKGLYSFTSETINDENGNEFTATYNLYLYENGTFNYRMATMGPFGYIGNYIIIDDTIILNYLFSTNSGAGIEVTTGNKTLVINNNNTITDNNQLISSINLTSITLEKSSLEDENRFLQSNDFSNILNNYNISN